MNVFKSNRFSYHKPTETFCVEASDLPELVFSHPFITIESTKTGQQVDFSYTGKLQEQEEYDGELVGWEYKSYNGYKIHVYND